MVFCATFGNVVRGSPLKRMVDAVLTALLGVCRPPELAAATKCAPPVRVAQRRPRWRIGGRKARRCSGRTGSPRRVRPEEMAGGRKVNTSADAQRAIAPPLGRLSYSNIPSPFRSSDVRAASSSRVVPYSTFIGATAHPTSRRGRRHHSAVRRHLLRIAAASKFRRSPCIPDLNPSWASGHHE